LQDRVVHFEGEKKESFRFLQQRGLIIMKANADSDKTLSEGQMVNLVRNALLVAGTEMGEDGDHWPVIKSTIHQMMQDFENLKIERDVFDEVKKSFNVMLSELEVLYSESSDELKPGVRSAINDFQQIYDASFADVNEGRQPIHRDQLPAYVKRAETIVNTLEEENG